MLYKDAKFIQKPKEIDKIYMNSVFTKTSDYCNAYNLPPCDTQDPRKGHDSDHQHYYPDLRARKICAVAKIPVAEAVRLMIAGAFNTYRNRVSRVARSRVAYSPEN